jgi:hypothetical protein
VADDPPLTITLPAVLSDQLRARANGRGTTVLEEIERAIAHHEHRRQPEIVPAGARTWPGHWLCRLRRHRGLRYRKASKPLPDGVTAMWIDEATCLACGRSQRHIRIRFPRNYTLTVDGPPPEIAATPEPAGRNHQ